MIFTCKHISHYATEARCWRADLENDAEQQFYLLCFLDGSHELWFVPKDRSKFPRLYYTKETIRAAVRCVEAELKRVVIEAQAALSQSS